MPASAGIFICERYLIVTLNLSFTARASRLLTQSSAALLALVCAAAFAQEEPQMNLPRVSLGAGMYQIDSQVAFTPEQRQIGLMFRKEMPAHEGMLFVFEQASTQCFWMKNTILPLSAAFVADDGSIVNIVDMKPQTTDSHCSLKPVRFVLEVNQGWFAKRKIQAGFKLTGKPFETGK